MSRETGPLGLSFPTDDGWRSPDTYSDKFFDDVINGSAVYAIEAFDANHCFTKKTTFIAYIGMATNLARRFAGHEVITLIKKDGFWPKRWFKPTPTHLLRITERQYIERFNPPYNIIGRRRGVQH